MMKKRIFKTAVTLAAILAAGIAYYLIPDNMRLKCPIFELTGLYCPGCGMTRMFLKLFKLDFYGAFRSNCAVFVCLPLFAVFVGMRGYVYIKTGKPYLSVPMKVIAAVMIAVLAVFGVLRNIPYFSFLLPQ